MEQSSVEQLFETIDAMTKVIETQMEEPYLNSLIMTMEFIVYGESDSIDQKLLDNIEQYEKKLSKIAFKPKVLQKAFQLAIVKGMKDSIQPQHVMTPETIALLIGYLAEKVTTHLDSIRIFDPVCGTGNLLTIVMEQLKKNLSVYANEIDPTLLRLSVIQADIQQKAIHFFHQDSLRPLFLDPVDLVIADLPVGYYPDQERAQAFELGWEEGPSYAHHLLLEQSMNYTKNGGYLLFLIPEFLFNSEQSTILHPYLHKQAHIVGVLQLPESAFKSKQNVKSILILQKKGEHTTAPQQPLLVKLPSLRDTAAMENILMKINAWFRSNYTTDK